MATEEIKIEDNLFSGVTIGNLEILDLGMKSGSDEGQEISSVSNDGITMIDTESGTIEKNEETGTEVKVPKKNIKVAATVKVEEESENIEDSNVQTPLDDNQDNSSSSPISAFAKFLYEQGVFSELNEEKLKDIKDVNGLAEMFVEEKNRSIGEFLETLDPRVKSIVDKTLDGYSLDSILEETSNNLTLDSITEDMITENKDLAKELVRRNLKSTTSMSDEKINKLITKYEDDEELIGEALESHGTLKELAKKEEANKTKQVVEFKAKQAEQAKAQLVSIQQDLEKTEELVPGMKWNKIVRDKVYKSMTQSVGKDAQGQPINAIQETRMKNPLAFEKALHYYHSIGLFNVDDKGNFKPDFSKINVNLKTSIVKDADNAITQMMAKEGFKNVKSDTSKPSSGNDFSLLENLKF